jgi:hypothetical protein
MTMGKLSRSVPINLVSQQKLGAMTQTEKISYILDEVGLGKILVLERGLTPLEEAKLIEATMTRLDLDTFIGIEMQSYGQEKVRGLLQKLRRARSQTRPRMSVIGPANLLQTVHKDDNEIQVRVLQEGIAT